MKKFINIFFFALLLVTLSSYSQTKEELQRKKKKLLEEISYANKILKEIQESKTLSLVQLLTLNKKINARQQLINTINKEIYLLNKNIDRNNEIINALENDLKKIKADYAKLIFYSYKNMNKYSRLLFILSSENFNQALQRIKYLEQFADYRKKQAKLIVEVKNSLSAKVFELEKKRNEKQKLLNSLQKEKINLSKEKEEKDKLVKKLKGEEKRLKIEIRKKEKDAKKLQKAIERIIAEEMRKAKEMGKLALTPEAMALSKDFISNKSKLPWPVKRGIIVSHFGEHPHPVLEGIKIKNNGIDIATTKNAEVRAIFDGTVSGIAIIPGAGKAVIIRHGEYLSVYSNLKEVYVTSGEKIKTKQVIGKVLTDSDSNKAQVHLEIWKGMKKLNPEFWIYTK